jgi:hypothetical protein
MSLSPPGPPRRKGSVYCRFNSLSSLRSFQEIGARLGKEQPAHRTIETEQSESAGSIAHCRLLSESGEIDLGPLMELRGDSCQKCGK